MTESGAELLRVLEFTSTPGARYTWEGPYSGEEFRESYLAPAFLRARKANTTLTVDLDGTSGYATSFLEESFGGLARRYGIADVLRIVKIKCDDEPASIARIDGYIRNADGHRPRPRRPNP
jgi:hypothetical protein